MCYMMIVTDNQQVNHRIKQLVQDYFMNVFLLPDAINTVDALDIAKKHTPEIALVDVAMTDDSPFELKKQLLKKHPNIRFIALDQEENFKNIKKAMQIGAVDYLVYPFDEQEILESIHRTIISLNQVSLLKIKTEDRVSQNNDMVYSMIDYIHTHFSEQTTLDDLASYMHLNKHYLSTLFKKEIRMTYNQYLTSYRMEQAKLLLRETDDLLADISHQVGYVDPAYFSRAFKKNTDMTPIIYRKTFRGKPVPV